MKEEDMFLRKVYSDEEVLEQYLGKYSNTKQSREKNYQFVIIKSLNLGFLIYAGTMVICVISVTNQTIISVLKLSEIRIKDVFKKDFSHYLRIKVGLPIDLENPEIKYRDIARIVALSYMDVNYNIHHEKGTRINTVETLYDYTTAQNRAAGENVITDEETRVYMAQELLKVEMDEFYKLENALGVICKKHYKERVIVVPNIEGCFK